MNEPKETTDISSNIHHKEIEESSLDKSQNEEKNLKEDQYKIDYFKKSDSENEDLEKEPKKEIPQVKKVEEPEKLKKKLSKKEKLKEIILAFYTDSLYYKFLESSSIILSDILYYKFPGDDKKTLETFFIITNFGIVILLKKENFVKDSQWYSFQLPSEQTPSNSDDVESDTQIKLPYKKEYYIIPFPMIDEINHSLNERVLEIITKVLTISQSGFQKINIFLQKEIN